MGGVGYWEPLEFELSPVGNRGGDSWHRWIDTALDSPHDIVEWKNAPPVSARSYRAGPRSVVVLFAGFGAVVPKLEYLQQLRPVEQF